MCYKQLYENTGRKSDAKISIWASSHNFVGLYHLRNYKACIGNRKTLLSSNISSRRPYNMVNFSPLTAAPTFRPTALARIPAGLHFTHNPYCRLGSAWRAALVVILSDNCHRVVFLWPPYVTGQAIIFLPCSFFLSSIFLYLLSFFPRLISAAARWMSTILWHMVWPYCEFRMQVWFLIFPLLLKFENASSIRNSGA